MMMMPIVVVAVGVTVVGCSLGARAGPNVAGTGGEGKVNT